jgi:hypothetical protein
MSIVYIYKSIRERTHQFHMATLGLWVQVGTRNTPLHVKGHNVAASRASVDAEVYTDDSAGLGQKLAHDVAKASAVKLRTYAPRMAPSLLHY